MIFVVSREGEATSLVDAFAGHEGPSSRMTRSSARGGRTEHVAFASETLIYPAPEMLDSADQCYASICLERNALTPQPPCLSTMLLLTAKRIRMCLANFNMCRSVYGILRSRLCYSGDSVGNMGSSKLTWHAGLKGHFGHRYKPQRLSLAPTSRICTLSILITVLRPMTSTAFPRHTPITEIATLAQSNVFPHGVGRATNSTHAVILLAFPFRSFATSAFLISFLQGAYLPQAHVIDQRAPRRPPRTMKDVQTAAQERNN